MSEAEKEIDRLDKMLAFGAVVVERLGDDYAFSPYLQRVAQVRAEEQERAKLQWKRNRAEKIARRECIARVCETTVASKMQIDVRPGELVMLFSTELRVFKPDSAPDRWQIEMPALHAIVFGDTPKETFREALRVIAERGAEREIMKEKKHGD